MYSISNKDGYLTHFLRKRVLFRLLIPAYAVYVINVMLVALMSGSGRLMNIFSIRTFFSKSNWYVWEIAALYILFYGCAKLDRSLRKCHWFI